MNENELPDTLGPLAPLYQDETVVEIMVDSPDCVYVKRRTDGGQQLQDIASPFKSPQDIRRVIDAVLGLDGITLGPNKACAGVPFLDGTRQTARSQQGHADH